MKTYHSITDDDLDLKAIDGLIYSNLHIKLSEASERKIVRCHNYLSSKIKSNSDPIYGINTGFGALCNVKVEANNLTRLQENLVKSHACGTGDYVPQHIIKLMLYLKVRSLSYGHSGVQLKTVERLIDFYNNDVLPVVYTQGSLGASGDLAPLAHLALPLIGEGDVWYKNKKTPASKILEKFNWEPIVLSAKEGLALLNGTQFMSAYGIFLIIKSYKLSYLADLISSLSIEAFDGRIEPFSELVHLARPHNGQLVTAKRIREFLSESKLITQPKTHTQDPYSFRCIPQVHGATKDTLEFIRKTFVVEINSVTDNPNIFPLQDEIISGGNFHGQPLALGFDYLKIAMSELANISERRIFQLVLGVRELPPFLVDNPGLNSGFMIPQYTAASIVSANKQLATPASIDSIVSSNGQEDHVSMGANAATQAYNLVFNVERVLAIELFNACQALDFRNPELTSPFLKQLYDAFRTEVPFLKEDAVLHNYIEKAIQFIATIRIDQDELY